MSANISQLLTETLMKFRSSVSQSVDGISIDRMLIVNQGYLSRVLIDIQLQVFLVQMIHWLNSALITNIANISIIIVFHNHRHPINHQHPFIVINIITALAWCIGTEKAPLGVCPNTSHTSFTWYAVSLRVNHNATVFLDESTVNLTIPSAFSLGKVNYTTENSANSLLEVECFRVLGTVWSLKEVKCSLPSLLAELDIRFELSVILIVILAFPVVAIR